MQVRKIALAIALLLTATTASMAQTRLRNYTHIASSQAGSGQAGPGLGCRIAAQTLIAK
jgi:hypothetical protein